VEGRAVLSRYGIGQDANWAERPDFALLPAGQQAELRHEFGELLLVLSRAEILRNSPQDPAAVSAAIGWDVLAESCYPADQRPGCLVRQRAEWLALAPGAAAPLAEGPATDVDNYHDGVEAVMHGRYREALAKLTPFADRHSDHFMAWLLRGIGHDGVGQNSD